MSDEYIHKPPTALPPGSLVIAYLRDSGGPNQENSIGQQLEIVTAYCKQYGLILGRVFQDTASGRKTKNRDQFLEMFNSVMATDESLRPAGLLLWAYSRFSRDIVDFNFYLYGLMKHGLTVHSLTEEIPEGLAGQIVLSVKAYTNADFSVQLGKNIKRGIAERVKAGYSNGGQAPRGYRIVRELHDSRRNGQPRIGIRWEIDPELAPLIRLAWELRAQGKGYTAISQATGGKVYTNKISWATHFRNKSYLGIGKAGDLEIPDHHEPLITWEVWEAVKRVEASMPNYGQHRKRGALLHHRRMSHPSLLSGLAFCVYCGAAMVLHTSKDYRSYACGQRDRKKGFSDCKEARRVNARKADTIILDAILNQVLSPSFVADLLQEIQTQYADTDRIDREIGNTNNLLIMTTRSITRLVQLAENAGDLAEITNRLKELKGQEAEHTAKIKALKAERDSAIPQITPEALALVFETWRDQITAAHENGDILTAKKLLAHFVQKIDLGYDTAIIHYTYPITKPAETVTMFCAH